MRTVFLDTVGLIALWDEADQWHRLAAQAFLKLRGEGFTGVTTEPILLECGNAAARRPYRRDVFDLRAELVSDGRVIMPTDADLKQAWQGYQRGEAGDAGIVDCISFTVMRRLGLSEAFTNDQHFTAAGFVALF